MCAGSGHESCTPSTRRQTARSSESSCSVVVCSGRSISSVRTPSARPAACLPNQLSGGAPSKSRRASASVQVCPIARVPTVTTPRHGALPPREAVTAAAARAVCALSSKARLSPSARRGSARHSSESRVCRPAAPPSQSVASSHREGEITPSSPAQRVRRTYSQQRKTERVWNSRLSTQWSVTSRPAIARSTARAASIGARIACAHPAKVAAQKSCRSWRCSAAATSFECAKSVCA
mmetsp:Transcript_42770/g.100264  ORF Transcript_42770/g.100264 Transcript_42770/m.100264 type:complete len:236 (-) Transcript_42770:683-1390(-)